MKVWLLFSLGSSISGENELIAVFASPSAAEAFAKAHPEQCGGPTVVEEYVVQT